MATIKLIYFAWVRERIGLADETVDVPDTCETVGDVLAWLKTRGPEYENAFREAHVIRAALDQTHVAHDHAISGARELAFFPPVTGG